MGFQDLESISINISSNTNANTNIDINRNTKHSSNNIINNNTNINININGNTKHELSPSLSSAIFQINTALSTFQRLISSLGTPRDTPLLRQQLHKTRLLINQLVKDATVKLRKACESDHLPGVSANKRIADAKLAKDFQAILKEYQKAQQLAAEREMTYSLVSPQAALPSGQKLSLPDDEKDPIFQQIKQNAVDVNKFVKNFSLLVHNQGVLIDDIQSNTENSHLATAQANLKLVKASKTKKFNSLICLLLVIFGVVLLIVIVVLMV